MSKSYELSEIQLDKKELKNYSIQEVYEFINKEGKKIYRENEFFRDLRDLMETPQFCSTVIWTFDCLI